jgi:hypothetical protein
MKETTIPFSGFYYSYHSDELDRVLEQMTEDDSCHQIPLVDSEGNSLELWEHINWSKVHEEYAKLYAENFCSWFEGETGIKLNAKFSALDSPRSYNFTTDRIFVKIPLRAVKELYKWLGPEVIDTQIKKRFTSYDGFISFYKNSLAAWPKDLNEWDCNQIGTLLETSADAIKDWEIMEDSNCNGELDSILWDALDQEGKDALNRIER